MQNKKFAVYKSLLLPSAIGAVAYTFISGLVLFLRQFSFIEQYLQIPSSINVVRIFLSWLDKIVNGLLGETRTETVVVGLFWAFVGLLVYAFLLGLSHFINDVSEGISERNYLWPKGTSRNQHLREVIMGSIFRFLALIGLIIAIFGPLNGLLNGPVFHSHSALITYTVWFVSLWLTMHVCVVLLRLVLLRPRLFN